MVAQNIGKDRGGNLGISVPDDKWTNMMKKIRLYFPLPRLLCICTFFPFDINKNTLYPNNFIKNSDFLLLEKTCPSSSRLCFYLKILVSISFSLL
jgi:hypothetical protein